MILPVFISALVSAVALAAHFTGMPAASVFGLCAISLVGWSYLLGEATEDLALTLGGAAAAVINVTFSNATELIVTLFALAAGLLTVVQASLIGSVLGNLLLLLGVSLVAAGAHRPVLRFERQPVAVLVMMIALATVAIGIVSAFGALHHGAHSVFALSVGVAPVMLILYFLSVAFLLRRHNQPSRRLDAEVSEALSAESLTRTQSFALMVVATLLIAVLSDVLVGSIAPTAAALHLGQVFIGLVLVPLIGNVAENLVAVRLAWSGKLDLSLGISMGSSLQIALLLTPLLVLLSPLLGHNLTLAFSPLEALALVAAVGAVAVLIADGESNWLEGTALAAVYVVTATAFAFS